MDKIVNYPEIMNVCELELFFHLTGSLKMFIPGRAYRANVMLDACEYDQNTCPIGASSKRKNVPNQIMFASTKKKKPKIMKKLILFEWGPA